MPITTPTWNTDTVTSSVPTVAQTEGRAESSAMGNVIDQNSKLSFSLDVAEFRLNELKVLIDGRTLTVEGKQEITEDSAYLSRSFLHRRTLPEGVDIKQVRSTISEYGQLTIEVPKPEPTVRIIPIRMTLNGQ